MEKEVPLHFYTKSNKELFKELNTNPKTGLNSKQAKDLLAKHGKNEIKQTNKLKPLKILLEQFHSFLIYILLASSIVMFYLGHLVDGIVIFIIVLLNAGIGFFQQYKAERAIIALRKMMVPKSTVIREGKVFEIPSFQLVPGDIILLEQGNKVNADCVLIEADDLKTNEAILTGESLPVGKSADKLPEATSLSKIKNMVFTGTQVVAGSSKALVLATGMNTVFGQIAETLQEIKEQKTPMQKRLDKFSKQLGLVIFGLIAVILLVGLVSESDFLELFMIGVALAVSAIPEGLPAVLAVAFSISSKMLSKKNVIVRKLPAVETLGSVTVICTDKTGTLTQEQMTIQEIFADNMFFKKKNKELFFKNKKFMIKKNKALYYLMKTSLLCNNARYELVSKKYSFVGDPTEEALIRNAIDLGFDKKEMIELEPSIKKFEFDSKRKMMSIVRDNKRNYTMYTKGAPDKLLEKCSFEIVNGNIKELTLKRKKEILENSKKMEREALRVLGFAYKNLSKKTEIKEFKEKGLIFLGFAGMIDPPRKEVKKAISECKKAGIIVKMITGDSPLTAHAIAQQIGIEGEIITDSELQNMKDSELLERMDKTGIFARITPHQKLRITKLLQERGETVAITGDGINDVLALKSADIGISMGIRGTDVARDVSDVVLVDDNFASLVEGVRQGRRTYDNIKKFTKYMLAVNFSEIFLILISILAGLPLPLLPLHILWINLITDSFPALALVFEKQENVMKRKPRKEKSILDHIWIFIVIVGIFSLMIKLFMFLYWMNAGIEIEKVRTFVMTTGIMFELLFVYSCRSNGPLLKQGIFSNKWLNYAVLFSIIAHMILLYTPLAGIFKLVPLMLNDWLFILPFAFSGLIVFEIVKYCKKKPCVKFRSE
jgi:P-type Ca2+ transporter type 2C